MKFDACEENYKFLFITEMGSFLTSFAFFLPYIYMNYLCPRGAYHKETLQ